ncbi:MAG: bifunctional glycosyltransferase family 2/GtrA family protein [Streptococcus sp.]|nr:bifunctional glycosyltransferase family 2/GtrA family protein [Streptococcus sp.]
MDYLVIPSYQPDDKLIHLIKKVKEKSDFSIIIVNDGSSTACDTLFKEAEQYATVLYHQTNLGKGEALKTAFRYIKHLKEYGTIVTADADGQHKVWDIFRVATKASKNPSHLVLGSRSFSGKVPLRSSFGNKLTRLLFKLQTGVAVQDTQTGLRAFTTNMIPFMMTIEGQRYEYEMNMLLEASKEYSILEIPIETIYINDNEGSHFRPIRDGLMIYKNIFKFTLTSLSSFVVDYLVYALALLLLVAVPTSLKIVLANGIARVTSSIFNYSTNKKLVFKNEESVLKTGLGYFGLAFSLFVLDTLFIRLFYAMFGFNLLFIKILVGALLFSLSWFIQKKFIFKERKHIAL